MLVPMIIATGHAIACLTQLKCALLALILVLDRTKSASNVRPFVHHLSKLSNIDVEAFADPILAVPVSTSSKILP